MFFIFSYYHPLSSLILVVCLLARVAVFTSSSSLYLSFPTLTKFWCVLTRLEFMFNTLLLWPANFYTECECVLCAKRDTRSRLTLMCKTRHSFKHQFHRRRFALLTFSNISLSQCVSVPHSLLLSLALFSFLPSSHLSLFFSFSLSFCFSFRGTLISLAILV